MNITVLGARCAEDAAQAWYYANDTESLLNCMGNGKRMGVSVRPKDPRRDVTFSMWNVKTGIRVMCVYEDKDL
jgi:hypothetical protein